MANGINLEVHRFVEGGGVAKNYNDHLWHGKALEGIGICLAILLHLKVDFQVFYLFRSTARFESRRICLTREI